MGVKRGVQGGACQALHGGEYYGVLGGAGKDGMLLLESHPMIIIWITMMMRRRKGC